ncbi:hypothetical protein M8542_39830 [Amycolatopsis sp. OK19-0408]|uniref:Uncharacterized protein n=1 Tax=Amycolatopsis iheyensis TaxID=2945988 RepID=A0A9X2NJI0_9PSEU|nr:hypothetical protein [Amycolatopsis iheyensis]MCR6488998.1 hypothetical protein [Amycolatopsis iheyensis]
MTAVAGASPEWARPVKVPAADRLLATTYLVVRRSGLRDRAVHRTWRKVLRRLGTDIGVDDPHVQGHALDAICAELSGTTAPAALEAAVADAVLLDGMLSLPPRQRFALHAALAWQWSVTDIATHTGWTRCQVHRLLRAGLTTVTARSRPSALGTPP